VNLPAAGGFAFRGAGGCLLSAESRDRPLGRNHESLWRELWTPNEGDFAWRFSPEGRRALRRIAVGDHELRASSQAITAALNSIPVLLLLFFTSRRGFVYVTADKARPIAQGRPWH